LVVTAVAQYFQRRQLQTSLANIQTMPVPISKNRPLGWIKNLPKKIVTE